MKPSPERKSVHHQRSRDHIWQAQYLRARGWRYRTAHDLKGYWLGSGPDALYGGGLEKAYTIQRQREEANPKPNFMWGLDIATLIGN